MKQCRRQEAFVSGCRRSRCKKQRLCLRYVEKKCKIAVSGEKCADKECEYMDKKFELFVMSVTRAYKYITQIKKMDSSTFGIKGIHVMCMVFLGMHPEGLTVSELTALCCEDKAAISRVVDSLVRLGYICDDRVDGKRRWRSKLLLTEEGSKKAGQMFEHINKMVDFISDSFTAEDELHFYKTFSKVNDNLARYIESKS